MTTFGYKNHVSIDRQHGLIRSWTVTDARPNGARQCGEIPGAFGNRVCLRPAERAEGPVRPDYRQRPCGTDDRPRQSRLQHAAPRLAQRRGLARMTENANRDRPEYPAGRRIRAFNPPDPEQIRRGAASHPRISPIRRLFQVSKCLGHSVRYRRRESVFTVAGSIPGVGAMILRCAPGAGCANGIEVALYGRYNCSTGQSWRMVSI